MPNNFLTSKNAPGIIAKLAAGMLADKVQFAKAVDKADESDWKGKNDYSAGDTIYIAQPSRFVPSSSANITSAIQDVVEPKVPLVLNIRRVIPIETTSAEVATEIQLKTFAKRFIAPAVSSIANFVESEYIRQATLATSNLVGTAGSTTFDTDMMLSANQKITEFGCPDFSDRYALLNPAATRSAVNARKGLFQSSAEIAKQYKEGYMGTADGFNYMQNNLITNVTTGTANVTGVTATANLVSGTATVAVTGLGGTNTVTAGTVFQIAGVNAVHPITKADLGYPQQFVVTATATASGGAATLSVSPTPQGPLTGGLQNVSTLTASSAALTFLTGAASTTRANNLAFHKSAFRIASVPLMLPDGVDMAAQETVDGMTIRVIRAYDVLQDRLITRLDFLGGLAAVRPEWACRVIV